MKAVVILVAALLQGVLAGPLEHHHPYPENIADALSNYHQQHVMAEILIPSADTIDEVNGEQSSSGSRLMSDVTVMKRQPIDADSQENVDEEYMESVKKLRKLKEEYEKINNARLFYLDKEKRTEVEAEYVRESTE
ncbi:hypothetical protein H4R33_001828 [Dimargaris cristalligena]|nr:hypothetical protein H4R33_001828 [Dimargaris cristalligena]